MKVKHKRSSYRKGVRLLEEFMSTRSRPPKDRKLIAATVEGIIKQVGLRGSNQEQFFRLTATVTLMGMHSLRQYWRRK